MIDTVIPKLAEDPNRKFIYVEIGFFSRWWERQPEKVQNLTKTLVARGQLEFINGGWCMHDEASPYYTAMVDQTTRGHMFIKKHFGDAARPKGTWQIDPFGHSNTEAWLLGAEAGMQSLFWGRTDYQDLDYRKAARNHTDDRWPEWVWQGSASLGSSAQVFAGELTTGGYGAPINFDRAGTDKMAQVQDDPRRHDYNVDAWVDKIIASARNIAEITKTSQQMWPCGSDFEYQNADHWYRNLDKLIHYVNQNGTINLMYSTPTQYTNAKHAETLRTKAKWEVRTDDIFPLGDNAHNYWSGYFTSRPALKRQVRFATNFLGAARQMEVIAKGVKVDHPTQRPSPVVGTSWTDSLEGTIGVATHHDGMSGTERQDVANDYSQRISESQVEAEVGTALSLEHLLGGGVEINHCSCNGGVGALGGDCLNISMCVHTMVDEFEIVAWNPQGRSPKQVFRVPVRATNVEKFEVHELGGAAPLAIPAQAVPLNERDYELPLLYLTFPELKNKTLVERARNKATHVLIFEASVPAVGYRTFSVKKVATGIRSTAAATSPAAGPLVPGKTFTNGHYNVEFDDITGRMSRITNVDSGATTSLSIDWGWSVKMQGKRVEKHWCALLVQLFAFWSNVSPYRGTTPQLAAVPRGSSAKAWTHARTKLQVSLCSWAEPRPGLGFRVFLFYPPSRNARLVDPGARQGRTCSGQTRRGSSRQAHLTTQRLRWSKAPRSPRSGRGFRPGRLMLFGSSKVCPSSRSNGRPDRSPSTSRGLSARKRKRSSAARPAACGVRKS